MSRRPTTVFWIDVDIRPLSPQSIIPPPSMKPIRVWLACKSSTETSMISYNAKPDCV